MAARPGAAFCVQQNIVEVGTNALFVSLLGGDIGSHALWVSFVAYCAGTEVEVLGGYLVKKGGFQGLPSS